MDALHKYSSLVKRKISEVERQNTALKSQVQALVNEKSNLNEMQQIMQLENDTNMQTIQDLVKEVNLINEQKRRLQRIVQGHEKRKVTSNSEDQIDLGPKPEKRPNRMAVLR